MKPNPILSIAIVAAVVLASIAGGYAYMHRGGGRTPVAPKAETPVRRRVDLTEEEKTALRSAILTDTKIIMSSGNVAEIKRYALSSFGLTLTDTEALAMSDQFIKSKTVATDLDTTLRGPKSMYLIYPDTNSATVSPNIEGSAIFFLKNIDGVWHLEIGQ